MNPNEIQNAHIVQPPAKIFRYALEEPSEKLVRRGEKIWLAEKVTYPPEGGIRVHFRGLLSPKKGFPFPEAINAVNAVKRAAVAMFRPIVMRELKWAWIGFALTPWKKKMKVLETALMQFNRTASYCLEMTPLGAVYMHPNYMLDCSYEIETFLSEFLSALNIGGTTDVNGTFQTTAKTTAMIIGTIFEFDDAYHYRLMDVFDTLQDGDLQRPGYAVKKIFDTLAAREEDTRVRNTFRDFGKIMRLAILHPKIRKAWYRAAQRVNVCFFQSDKDDQYHMLNRSAYKYMGLNDDQKFEKWKEIHAAAGKPLPQMVEIQ